MEYSRNVILVAWDFTLAGENALDHALRIALQTGHKIRLLHVMKKGSGVNARAKAEKQIKQVCRKFSEDHNLLIDYFIIEGSLFDKITPYAENNNAGLVIMGTHGIKGLQKWFGSRAMKVINGSKIPFIVVQDKPKNQDEISNVIYPLNGHPKEIEKISWTAFIARYLNSKVHLLQLHNDHDDKSFKTNLNLSLKKFLKNNISYTIYRVHNALPSTTISMAKKVNAELIVWLGGKQPDVSGLSTKDEERLIANNEKIPVMYIHPDSEIGPV
jgi:nucleotide-binding universal stress UspA family protein